jgi:hypothetical protein
MPGRRGMPNAGASRGARSRFPPGRRKGTCMKLVVTVDVEEEGLFSGRYPSGNVSVSNVSWLRLLDPLFLDLGIRPTLLVTYHVARHGAQMDFLSRWTERWGGEMGAHLHPWNTPPLDRSSDGNLIPSERSEPESLAAKLSTLVETLRFAVGSPVSFRMGRFDMGPRMFSVLDRTGIQVDSSVAPMRRKTGGPDHLAAPVDPYHPCVRDPRSTGGSHILEVPITIVPVVSGLGTVLQRLAASRVLPPTWISGFAMYVGSLPAQPAWTGPTRLRAAVRLHRLRGGQVVTLFFHSSELMPGGSPQHPSPLHVERFLEKLKGFLRWLRMELSAESVTLGDLHERGPTVPGGPRGVKM